MKGNLSTFYFLVTSQIILLLFLIGYASYLVELDCPAYTTIQNQFDDIPVNETNAWTALTNGWAIMTILFTGCGSIPWWIWTVVFVPALLAIIVYVVPFIGN